MGILIIIPLVRSELCEDPITIIDQLLSILANCTYSSNWLTNLFLYSFHPVHLLENKQEQKSSTFMLNKATARIDRINAKFIE